MFGLIFLATLYGLHRDDKKPNYESRQLKGCFPSKRRTQSITNPARAIRYKCQIQVKGNHPQEDKDLEPPRKIKTRPQVRCLSSDYLLLRRLHCVKQKNILHKEICGNCHFSKITRNQLRKIIFKIVVHFSFRMQKALVKNEIGVSGLIFSNLRHKLNVRSGKSF